VRILIAEDDQVLREELTSLLRTGRHTVTSVSDGQAARIILETELFDLVIMDFQLPHMDAFEVIEQVRRSRAATTFVLMTGHTGADVRSKAERLGVDYFLAKPFEVQELERILKAVEKKRL
jgi:DNA-binding response OmpR family regulator